MDKLCLSGPKHRPRTAQRTSRSGWRPLLSDTWGPMSCPIPAHLQQSSWTHLSRVARTGSCCIVGDWETLMQSPPPNDRSSLYGTSHQYPPLSAHRSSHAGVCCLVINTRGETRFAQSERLFVRNIPAAVPMACCHCCHKRTSVDYSFRTLVSFY